MKTNKGFAVLRVVSAVLPLLAAGISAAFAANIPSPPGITSFPSSPITGATDVSNIFCGLLSWVFWGVIVLAIVFALVGAYRYVTSSGDAEKVRTANRTLLYAAVAVAVAIIASGVPYIVSSFIGGGLTNGVCSNSGGGLNTFGA
jgi:hypothetical protein